MRSYGGRTLSQLTSHIDQKIKSQATAAAEKRMPENWDRKSLVHLNVFNTYFMEALFLEYGSLIISAHAHGYIQGIQKSLTVTQSLRAFYEDI